MPTLGERYFHCEGAFRSTEFYEISSRSLSSPLIAIYNNVNEVDVALSRIVWGQRTCFQSTTVRGGCSSWGCSGLLQQNLWNWFPGSQLKLYRSCFGTWWEISPGLSTQSISCTIRPCPGDYSFRRSLAIVILTLQCLTVRHPSVVQYEN